MSRICSLSAYTKQLYMYMILFLLHIIVNISYSRAASGFTHVHSRTFCNGLFLNKYITNPKHRTPSSISVTSNFYCFVYTRLIFPDVSLKENLTFMHYSIDSWRSVWLRNFESAKLHCSVRAMAWWRKVVEVMLPCYG